MKKKTFLFFILLMCLIVSGCSIGGSGKGQYGTKEPSVKGTLNIGSYKPDTLNPLTTEYSCVRDFLHLVYEGLFIVNEDFSVTGVLAKDFKASKDNTVFTINLKKNVKFHDGSQFDAEDVVASFDYITRYSSYYKDLLSDIKSYKVQGDYTVIITLYSPKANFPCNLDFPILPSGMGERELLSADFNMNGTGRYKYNKTNPYESIILTKNEAWHGKASVYIPTVCIRFLNDNESILHAFDSGETDIITTDRARWGEFSYTGNFKTYEITSGKYIFIGIKTRGSVFSDVEMRRSLASIVDKEKIIDTVMFSHGVEAVSPISAKAYFYRNDNEDSKTGDSQYLIKNKPKELFVLFNKEDKTKELIAKNLVQELQSIGIKASLSSVDYDTYVSKVKSGDYGLYIGKVDIKKDCDIGFMFNRNTQTQVADTSDLIQYSPASMGANTSEISDFSDVKLNDIINNINSATNTDAMKVAYNNLKSFYDENVPQIPLVHMNDAVFVNGRIKGAPKPNLTNFYADIGGIYIE